MPKWTWKVQKTSTLNTHTYTQNNNKQNKTTTKQQAREQEKQYSQERSRRRKNCNWYIWYEKNSIFNKEEHSKKQTKKKMILNSVKWRKRK